MTRERRQRLMIFCVGIFPAAVLAIDLWLYVSMEGWTYSLLNDGTDALWPGVLMFGLVCFPLAAAFLGYDLFHYWSKRESLRWPVADGRVTAARIEIFKVKSARSTFDTSASFTPIITYAYEVAGTTHSDDIPLISHERREAADAVLRLHPVGAPLRVHYDPQDPGASVPEAGDDVAFGGVGGALVCAAVPFVLITVVTWLA